MSSKITKISEQIFLGNQRNSRDSGLLKKLGISNIIRAAIKCKDYFKQRLDFHYLSLDLYDDEDEYLINVFVKCFKFIDKKTKNAQKILIHC